MPDVAELVGQHKRAFTHRLAEVAAAAGARDPETLARHVGGDGTGRKRPRADG
jgi:hypothetical protein